MNRPNLSLSTPGNWPADAVPREWVESLFKKMAGYYGSKFADQWGDTDRETLMRVWGVELAKLKRDELKRGVDRLISRQWPPTLPEFVALCRPRPSIEAAFAEAVEGMRAREHGEMGAWSDPAIYWAALKVGAFEMRTQTFAQIGGRFKTALEAILEGGPCADIPAPVKALPMPGKSFLSRDAARRMLADLQATGIFRVDADRRDPLAWAKKILQRVADGDLTVSPLQKRFATEALGAKGGE